MEQVTAITVRQRYSAEIWKERITKCRGSGQSVRKWCEMNSINCKSYYHWERKLLGDAGKSMVSTPMVAGNNRFAEIPITRSSETTVAVIRRGNFICEIQNGISSELLDALVQAMHDHA